MTHSTRALFALLLAVPSIARAQSRHEIVRGRVTSDSGRAVPGAEVVVTRTADRVAKSATTASTGVYTIDWPDGSGDYAVMVAAPGFQSRTVHAVRSGDSVIVADVALQRAVT